MKGAQSGLNGAGMPLQWGQRGPSIGFEYDGVGIESEPAFDLIRAESRSERFFLFFKGPFFCVPIIVFFLSLFFEI